MKKITKIILVILALSLVAGTMLAMTACNKKDSKSLVGVSFEDGVLSWDKDSIVGSAADAFQVFVGNAKKAVQSSEDGKTFFVNLVEEIKGGDFNVKVSAKGDSIKIDQTISFRRIPDINVVVKNGVFDWSESASEYASLGTLSYDIILDGTREDSTFESTYKATTGVMHTLRVRPRVSNSTTFYFSDWSDEITASVLSTPKVTSVDWTVERNNKGEALSATAIVNWTAPAKADGVEFIGKINELDFKTTEASLDTSKIEDLDVKNGFSISIQAVSINGDCYDSAMSEEEKFISLGQVKNVKLDDGIVKYDAVEGAMRYCININGNNYYSDNTYYVIDDSSFDQLSIKVCALAGEEYSQNNNYSDVLDVRLLSAPDIYYDSKAFIIYGNLQNVAAYQLKIEKEEIVDGKPVYQLKEIIRQDAMNKIFNSYDFEEDGIYRVSIKSIAVSGSGFGNSVYSQPYEVVRLGVISGVAISEIPAGTTAGSYLDIKILDVDDTYKGVTKYQLYMDGTEISSTNWNEFKIPKPGTYDEMKYIFSIRHISNDNGSSDLRRVVLSALDSASFVAYKLATPRNVSLNSNASVSWEMPAPVNDELKNANGGYSSAFAGYQVIMGRQNFPIAPTQTELSFSADLSAGEIAVNVFAKSKMEVEMQNEAAQIKLYFAKDESGKVKVSQINDEKNVVGNGSVVLSSDYSSTEILVRLNQPKDMSIENQILSWTGVEGSVGYNIYYSAAQENGQTYYGLVNSTPIQGTSFRFDQGCYASAENPELFIRSLIQEGGCVMNIVAVGNKGVALRSGERYSFDSIKSENVVIFRNNKPTGLQINDSNLSWNAVANASAYEVYDYDMLWRTVENNSISISGLDSGVHELKVVAVGDRTKFFDSDYSDILRIHKLDEMQIAKKGDEYVWRAVPYAIHYQLVIDGKIESVAVDAKAEAEAKKNGEIYYYTFKPTFSEPKAQTEIRYRTLANNGAINEEFGGPVIASREETFYQKVVRIDTPQMMDGQPGFTLSSNFGKIEITANVKDAPENCTYKYEVASINYYSPTKTFKYNEGKINPGEYAIRIAYGANYFDENGVYYLDSAFSESSKTVVFLREPYNITVQGTSDSYTIKWEAIDKAAGYRAFYEIYELNPEDKSIGEGLYASELMSDLTDHSFSIKLSTILGGNYSVGKQYAITVYLVTFGNNASSVSFYDVAEATLKGLK